MAAPVIRTGPKLRLAPGLIFISCFLFPVLGWLSYNGWDQPLQPGIQDLLDRPIEPVPQEENLFLALLGFPISGEEAAHLRGASALAAYEAALSIGPAAPPPNSYAAALGRYSAHFEENGLHPCSAGHDEGAYACLRSSREQRAGLEDLMQTLRPLLLRYRELESYPRYVDVRPAALDEPPPDPTAYRVALLNLSRLAWMVDEAAVPQAVEGLERSASIWRRVLAAREVGLIDKMFASRAYAAHLLFASELIRGRTVLEGPTRAAIERLLEPLSAAELSLSDALERELRIQARMWKALADGSNPRLLAGVPGASSWWYRFMIKNNDSLNRSHADLEGLMATEHAGCVEVRSRVEALAARGDTPEGLPWYAYLYNPIGRVMHAMSSDVRRDLEYLGRQCNLLALQRMVKVQLELALSGAADPQAISAQLQALAPHLGDPNSAQPFRFDPDRRTLSFEFIGSRKEFLTPLPLDEP